MIAAVLVVALGSAPVSVAYSRCNSIQADAIAEKLQDYAKHPSDQTQRSVQIALTQTDAEQERTILQGVCPASDYGRLASRLYALEAWGDLLGYATIGPSPMDKICPDANKKVMIGTAAHAWQQLALAATVTSTPTSLVATLTPQVRALAAKGGLTLPPFAQATAYWEQHYENSAKQAMIDCGSKMMMPTPTP
ncbi:MAG TPA: hypothetical protein VMF11_04110 [Candidatus Baltobacteraceae bacterium]|nr:hypothetical protein [Candidatus Baltobacteraceae bacterium]